VVIGVQRRDDMPITSLQSSEAHAPNNLELQEGSQESRCQRGLNIVVSLQSSSLRLMGVLHDLIPGELLITLDHPLSEGLAVTIELQSAQLQGEVVYCAAKGDRYEANIQIADCDSTGLRHAPRFTVDLPARIFPADETESVDGRLVDISAMGIGLEVPLPLRAGEVVAVETDANVTFGVVRYSRQLPEGTFRVGAETYHVMPKERKKPPARKRWLNVLLSAVDRF
jgi:hypothetical protein